MLVKLAAFPFVQRLENKFGNFAKTIARNEGKHNLLESGMLIPTIAASDGLADATLFHEKGKSRVKEFGKGALSGGFAGAVIGGGDVAVHHIKQYGEKLLHV